MPQGSRRIAVVPFLILLTLSAVPIQADPTTFAPGDVFVGAENILQWFHPDGTLNRTLSSGDGTEIAELAFGADGSLYVSYWRTETPAGGIDLGKFDSMGNFIGPLGTVVCPLTSGSIHLSPLGIAPTADGNFYFSCPAFIPSESRLIKVDLQGNILQTLDFPNGVGLISLTLDSCTLFNAVGEGSGTETQNHIERINVCTGGSLPSTFSLLPTGNTIDLLRALPNGQVLIATTPPEGTSSIVPNQLWMFDSAGQVMWSKTAPR